MTRAADQLCKRRPLRCRYVESDDPTQLLGVHTLALFGFGDNAPSSLDDPRYVHVGLPPWVGTTTFEVWESAEPVTTFRNGAIAGAENGLLCFSWLSGDEATDDVASASEHAYRALTASLQQSAYPQLLRVWNYLDAITDGEGDDERYRQFCVGRANGMQHYLGNLPAATAIGRNNGQRSVRVFWLSTREPGHPLENPRQVAAYNYPREYGPRPPSFARAMLPPTGSGLPLMLSGTASVVGHRTQHVDDLDQQLLETLRNLDALIAEAHRSLPTIPRSFDASSLLKVYVRHAEHLPRVEQLLRLHLPDSVPRLLLHADICRRDLLIEIGGFHGL